MPKRYADPFESRVTAEFRRGQQQPTDIRLTRREDDPPWVALADVPTVGIEVGRVAPEVTGEDLDGKPFGLSDYRGKVVALLFWGHW